MRIEILTIGGEILSGRIVDSNFQYLARALSGIGVAPIWHTVVPDHREALAGALRQARERADGVITTGGLGATPDDLTRRVISQVLGRKLILDESVWEHLGQRYRRLGLEPPTSGQTIALVPQGAEVIPNPVGLAPGLLLADPHGWICALPGVPEEMRAQVERFLLPFLERRLGGARGSEVVLRTAGVSETVLSARIGEDHPDGLEVAYLPQWGGVDLRLICNPGAKVTPRQFELWVRRIEEHLDPGVLYARGDQSLEQVLGERLAETGLRIAVAESLTGGAIGAALTRVPGSSRYFLGSVAAYSDEAKLGILRVPGRILQEQGAVSGETAEAMARGVRKLLNADLAVSTTGIAGPTGGSKEKPVGLVFFGLSTPDGELHLRRQFAGTREGIVGRTVMTALHLVYRHLLGQPLDGPRSGQEPMRVAGEAGRGQGGGGGGDPDRG